MSFNSNASKYQAENTVDKLFSNILHTSTTSKSVSKSKSKSKSKPKPKPISSTQLLVNQLQSTNTTANNNNTKRKKHNNNKRINKTLLEEKKFSKFIKYNHIKQKSNKSELDEKYLNKLVRKNINSLNKINKIDDLLIDEELNQIKQELLEENEFVGMGGGQLKGGKRLRKKLLNNTKQVIDEFDGFGEISSSNNNNKKKNSSYPGLTPGLAPVDYEEEDDE